MADHFLRITDLTRSEAARLVDRALEMKQTAFRSRAFEGKLFLLIFEKSSTRTRVSFEAAVNHLGGETLFMTPADAQLGRGEPLKDTARVLSRYADCLVVRTFGQEKLEELASYGTIPVVNALSDASHPCQVMSDVLTMKERTPDLSAVKVAWLGDGNNMANAWVEAAIHFPFYLCLAVPKGYEPDMPLVERAIRMGAKIYLTHEPNEAARDADYVNTDVWASMGQESQALDRHGRFAAYQVNAEMMALAKPDAKFMHCLPAKRGQEVTDEVIESPASIVWDQAENRLHFQKALLEYLVK